MAKQTINIGTTANDGTGDPLRTAFDKVNDNTTELYSGQSLSIASDILTLTRADGTTSTVDLSTYLDEDSRAIASGTINGSGIVTFTRDDASTFTLDLSSLLDDTNLVTSVNSQTGAVSLGTSDVVSNNEITAAMIVDNVQLEGTESVGVPSGTTAQRPGSPSAGMFRYNSTTNEFEGYTTSWGAIGGGDLSNIYVDTFTGDGSTTGFTASQSISTENNTQIYIDGVYQSKSNYSTSGTTVTFTTAPPNGSAIEMIHVKSIALTTVAADSITYEKLDARFTEKQDITSTSGTVNLDTSSYSIFEFTSSLTGATTLNLQNMKKGQAIDILLTGAQTITFSSDFSTSTFNKLAAVDYDGANTNHIVVYCIDDNDSDAILNYIVAPYTSDTTP